MLLLKNIKKGSYTIDIGAISNKANKCLNEVWGVLDMKEDNTNSGYIKFTIKSNEQNQKITGQSNDFYDDENDIQENQINITNKTRENIEKGLPTFKKYLLSVLIYLGEFAIIPNFTDKKNFKYKIKNKNNIIPLNHIKKNKKWVFILNI